METDKTAAVLEDLIETLEDGRKGFEQAAERIADSDEPALAIDLREYSQQRAEFSVELRNLAGRHGFEIDEEGSMAGALHRGWLSLKDALSGDDPRAVLAAAESGEDHAVSEFEDALAEDLPADVRSVIERQAREVRSVHDKVKALRDSR
ncbi:MAG TPA: PA2169 family four-helix-bundle protein [Acidimicrobiia bacterium]|nr:PA2169 family four-helix-bundle protein [Acidimicrobiia bacterium]